MAIEEKYEEVKQLIILGKERGYLLYDEINDLLPAEINTSEEIDELFLAFGEHGIELVDSEEKYLELKQSERKVRLYGDSALSWMEHVGAQWDQRLAALRDHLRQRG